MCAPILIAAGIGAGMGLLQGMGNKSAADQQAADLRQNALYLNNAANDAIDRGMKSADQQRVQTGQFIGTQRAAQAANGGEVNTGSNALLQEDTAALGELDALTISNNAAREAYGYQVQASSALTNASTLQSNARKQMLTSVLGGAISGASAGGGGLGGLFGSAGGSAALGAGTQAALSGGATRSYNQAYA